MKKTDKELTFALEINNILSLVRWLGNLPLSGMTSRKRTTFLKYFSDPIRNLEEKRVELLKSNAEKSENGNPVILKDDDGSERYDVKGEGLKKFNEDFNKLLGSTYEIKLDDENYKIFKEIKSIVLNTDFEFSGNQANEYEIWCEAFEAI